jgi:hypothetical protein
VAGIATVIAAVAAAGVWMRSSSSGGRVVRHEIRGNVLAVINEYGKEAWTYRFDSPIEDMDDNYGTSRFADLDGDQRPELLFVQWREGRVKGLFCFRASGKLAWRYDIGREITDGQGHSIPSHYWVRGIEVLSKPRPDGGRILILAHHVSDWPSQIAVLNQQGKQVAEYWHPGWLLRMQLADLDGDAIEEVLISGVNENEKAATLMVLDSRFPTGQGPAGAGVATVVKDIPDGEHRALLFFPDVFTGEGTPDPQSALADLQWQGDT